MASHLANKLSTVIQQLRAAGAGGSSQSKDWKA